MRMGDFLHRGLSARLLLGSAVSTHIGLAPTWRLSISFGILLLVGTLTFMSIPTRVAPPTASPGSFLNMGSEAMVERTLAANTNLTLITLPHAAAQGAVCLDGSSAGYYYRHGDPSRVLIGLLGGGWCTSPQDCWARSRTVYGTSSGWPASIEGMGVTSGDRAENPAFFNWTIAFLWYCDGTSYAGDLAVPMEVQGDLLWFRGRRIFNAVVDDLLTTRQLSAAKDVVLYGESAGGVGCFTHLDGLAETLPQARVRGLCDSSFFGSDVTRSGTAHFKAILFSVYSQFNLSAALDSGCAAAQHESDRWRCLFPPILYGFLDAPVFVLQSLYDCMHLKDNGLNCLPAPDNRTDVPACGPDGLTFFQDFGKRMLDHMNTSVMKESRRNGLYTDACIHHSIGLFGGFWNNAAWTVRGKTAARAVAGWVNDEVGPHVHVDDLWPHNPTCIGAFETCLGARSKPPWQCGTLLWQEPHCF